MESAEKLKILVVQIVETLKKLKTFILAEVKLKKELCGSYR